MARQADCGEKMPERVRQAVSEHGLRHPIAHDSYLINLAAPDDELWRKSIDAFVDELQRAALLGLAYLVAHPGSYTSSSEEAGLARIVAALDEVHAQTRGLKVRALLENTVRRWIEPSAGGSNTWPRFFPASSAIPSDWAWCIDTRYTPAAGYPLIDEQDYRATFATARHRIVGLEQIKAFHLNDSQKGVGLARRSACTYRRRATLGLEPFRHLLNDE